MYIIVQTHKVIYANVISHAHKCASCVYKLKSHVAQGSSEQIQTKLYMYISK